VDVVSLALSKGYTNEKLNSLPSNAPTKTVNFDGGIYSVGSDVVNGQVSACVIKGQTWTNKAGVGDTSPQTVENLDAAKTYLLINSAGANVEIDTVDTPTPVKLTGETSFDFVWASGKIALYELSAEEAALDVAVLGQKYHYVNGTKSTNSVRVKSVGKNIWDIDNEWDIKEIVDGVVANKINGFPSFITGLPSTGSNLPVKQNIYKSNTQYTLKAKVKGLDLSAMIFYIDGTKETINIGSSTFADKTAISASGKTVKLFTFSTGDPAVSYYIQEGTLQLEEGTVATEREPYKKSIVNVNLPEPLRSLPNGVKDEVNVTSGIKTQRAGEYNDVHTQTNWTLTDSGMPEGYVRFNKVLPISNALSVSTGSLSNINLVIGDVVFKNRPIDHFGSATEEVCGLRDGNNLYILIREDRLATVDSPGFEAWLQSQGSSSLIYQLAEPIVTKLPAQPPLQIYENGTVYVEPIGDASESTLPSVEMTIPTGTSSKFGVATHDYGGAAADWVLTKNEANCGILIVTNAGGAANIIVPNDLGRFFFVKNDSGYDVVVKSVGAEAGTTIADGNSVIVFNIGD
jgi:hypothetical protein